MFWRYNSLPLSWALLILALSLMSGKDMPETDIFSFDKFAHFFLFAVFTFLSIVGLKKQYASALLRQKALSVGVMASLGYGLVLELAQGLIPGRTLDYLDFGANALGSGMGLLGFYLIYKL
ncbi:MAG: VanZ family protein [Cytophagales bacterium]|nr:VanZ family protein [Cytophagales bacterium]